MLLVIGLLGCGDTNEGPTPEELAHTARQVDIARGHPHARIGQTWRELHRRHELLLKNESTTHCIYLDADEDGVDVGAGHFESAEWILERAGHHRMERFVLVSDDPTQCPLAAEELTEWYGRAVVGSVSQEWAGKRIAVTLTQGDNCTVTWRHLKNELEQTADPCPVPEPPKPAVGEPPAGSKGKSKSKKKRKGKKAL